MLPYIGGADVCLGACAIGQNWFAYAGHDFPYHRIIDAQYRQSVKRQVLQELNKCLFDQLEVSLIRGHVIGIDIGHHCHQRLQVQERRIAFIGFGNQIFTAA